MIVFPSDSLYQLRRSLGDRIQSGDLTAAEAFREALAADPNDSTALMRLGIDAQQTGDLVEAERLARASIQNHPHGPDGYRLLLQILDKRGADPQLVSGYTELWLKNIAYDEEALDALDFGKILPELPAEFLAGGHRNYELLQMILEHLEQSRLPEPAAVTHELEPYRVVHQLREAGEEPVSPKLIDTILARAEDCAPMLLGILREYGEDLIPEEDDPLVLRALALLGEFGDVAVLPQITEFLELEEEGFGDFARWAFHRISFRQPAAALNAIRQIIPQSAAVDRASLALQIAELPDVPGRLEVLQTVLNNLEQEGKEEQEVLLVGAITAAWVMQGRGSEFAASLLQKYRSQFTAATLKELKKLRVDGAGIGPYFATEDLATIYDVCGEDFGPPESIVKPPRPGRNDPCWCGSGRKYKKCHLDEDEGR